VDAFSIGSFIVRLLELIPCNSGLAGSSCHAADRSSMVYTNLLPIERQSLSMRHPN
jgi:hypothetical protein